MRPRGRRASGEAGDRDGTHQHSPRTRRRLPYLSQALSAPRGREGAVLLCHLAHDRRGVAALEFSLIASFMAVLMLAAFDIGNAAQHEIQLQAAVRAGGQYAMTFPTDTAGIQNAVSNSLPNSWTLSAPATVACYCLNSSTGATSAQPDCGVTTLSTNCTGANAGKVISISATMPYTALTPVFADLIPNNSATYVVRIQ